MSDVRTVFITSEVAKEVERTSSYVIHLAKNLHLDESEMREAGMRNYLFSQEGLDKIKQAINKNKK